MKSLSKNTLLNIAGQGIPLAIALFAIPISIQHLGDTLFGILTIALIVVGASTLFDLGMGRTTTKFSTEAITLNQLDKIPLILGCATFTQIILGLIGCVAVIVLAPIIANEILNVPSQYITETQDVIVLSGISIPIALISGSYRGLLEASHRFDIVNILRIIFNSLTYLSPLIGIAFGWGVANIVALILVFRLFHLITLFYACKRLHPLISWVPKYNYYQFHSMFGFGGWVALSNLLSPLQENMERIIVASLLPIAQLTYYSAPKEMLDRIYILPGSITAALFPTLTSIATSEKDKLLPLFVLATKIILISVALPLFLIAALAHPLLTLWVNEEFASLGALVVQILALGALASSLNSLAMTLFQSVGRPDITPKQQLIRFPIIAIIAWVLISEYGLAGAATSWTFGRLLALVMNWWALVTVQDWKIGDLIFGQIGISLLVLVAISLSYISIIFLLGTSVSLKSELLITTSTILLISIILWRFALTYEEREWMHLAIKRVLGKTI